MYCVLVLYVGDKSNSANLTDHTNSFFISESYNPHVRYGEALAVGISCAGTRLSEAIWLVEPLTSNVVDFVRQGALIAMVMVLVQTNKAREPRVKVKLYPIEIDGAIILHSNSRFFLNRYLIILTLFLFLTSGVNLKRSFLTNMKTP